MEWDIFLSRLLLRLLTFNLHMLWKSRKILTRSSPLSNTPTLRRERESWYNTYTCAVKNVLLMPDGQ